MSLTPSKQNMNSPHDSHYSLFTIKGHTVVIQLSIYCIHGQMDVFVLIRETLIYD